MGLVGTSDDVKVPEKCLFCESFHKCKLIEQRCTDICNRNKRQNTTSKNVEKSSNSEISSKKPNLASNIQAIQKTNSKKKKSLPVSVGNINQVEIKEKSDSGSGIARIKGFDIYVQGGEVGDRIRIRITKVKPNYALAVKADEGAKTYLTNKKSPPVSIDDIHEVEIKEKSDRGGGIARIKGFVIFVRGGKVGDYMKIRITKVKPNCAFAVKEDDVAKTYLTNNGPVEPISINTNVGSELIFANPWASSGNKRNRNGIFHGRCGECGGNLVWDDMQHCSYCVECGLEA